MLKADLHCHTYFSGKTNHMKAFEPMDSYNTPQRVYQTAKQRGMDLVTITDHDSIDGCLAFLDAHPDAKDFIIGEEVSVYLPEFDNTIHIGVFDLTESQHREIQSLRADFDELIGYLRASRLPYVLNHLFHGFPSARHAERFMEKMIVSFDLFEGINGSQGHRQNLLASVVVNRLPGKSLVGGSDAHTLTRLGTCYTVTGGGTREDFLESLRQGRTQVGGVHGRFTSIWLDAMGVYCGYFRDLAFRREVHNDWSGWKKLRNGLGWWVCLPVFFTGSLVGALVHYNWGKVKHRFYLRFFEKRYDLQTGLAEEMLEGFDRLGLLPKGRNPSSSTH
jgi:predicted metal-dependent phosphoesterase TrpH